MVIVAAMAVMLVGATALATDDAFATKKKYNQATSQANACGNGKLPLNVFRTSAHKFRAMKTQ